MEVITGALPSVITKLGDLLMEEYSLQKGVKGEIRFLQCELESMKGALDKVASTPSDRLDIQDKIWARDLRELSYDIEDSIDAFMVLRGKGGDGSACRPRGIRKFIDRSVDLFRKAKARHGIATEIRDIKSRVSEVHKRRLRYHVTGNGVGAKLPSVLATVVDPRLLAQYTADTKKKELVGIDESSDELIKVLLTTDDGNGVVPLQQGKVVSVVGFGGLGKTTLAKAVYEKIGPLFDCCAFVPVSQTPDMKKLLMRLLYDLGNNDDINEGTLDESRLVSLLRGFLESKRYLVVIDDIWDISVWKLIKCALPDNDVGYIVITTTRNVEVAENAGGAYKLKPLSEDNSRKLLYRRVFGNENNGNIEDHHTEKCPDEELAEISDRILEKCAGVPLAIITMASLLACRARNKMDWYEVYRSIGAGLEHNNLDVENMRKILSFSYYDLPSHLRTCLLYLSMFPEDYVIEKNHLIWMWIAEGFIQCERQRKKKSLLFELGESYFNALINRSMIQPIFDEPDDGMVYRCHVHDMVLDLIRSLSSEANFVTVFSGLDHQLISPSTTTTTIRRLSLQNDEEADSSMALPAATTTSFQQVRSLAVYYRSATGSVIPPVLIRSFQGLRVLNLEHCDLSHDYSLNKCLGKLLHLRYLRLCSTGIAQLPEEIGNLQFLQTLDIRDNSIASLPSNVVKLTNLMCLNMDTLTGVPNGIGSLTSLEELSHLWVHDEYDDMHTTTLEEELGQLTELRVLHASFWRWKEKLVDSLHRLQNMQDLSISASSSSPATTTSSGLDAWVAPRCLRRLEIRGGWFSALPAWMMNPSSSPLAPPNLRKLCVGVRELRQADLDVLGRSQQALRVLELDVDHRSLGILGGFVVGAGSFPCLTRCWLRGFARPVVFRQGAMPRLRTLRLHWFSDHEEGSDDDHDGVGVGLDFGLGHLPSLQVICVECHSEGARKKEMEAMLRHATKIHPNHPHLQINRQWWVNTDDE